MSEKILENNNEIIACEILKNSRRKLSIIFVLQTILIILTMFILVVINIFKNDFFSDKYLIIINSSFLGFLGSLVYFSRKSYVYLISKKISILIHDIDLKINVDIESIKSTVRGYYLYLLFRPLVGFIIGPILYMFALAGLITFMKKAIDANHEISKSGEYFIYVIAFLGGHTSSDVLDRFSKIAKKIVVKENE